MSKNLSYDEIFNSLRDVTQPHIDMVDSATQIPHPPADWLKLSREETQLIMDNIQRIVYNKKPFINGEEI